MSSEIIEQVDILFVMTLCLNGTACVLWSFATIVLMKTELNVLKIVAAMISLMELFWIIAVTCLY